MFSAIGPILSALGTPLIKYFTKRQQTKKAIEVGNQKLAAAKIKGEQDLVLKDAEWEALAKKAEQGTWKDEYITIVITSPFVLVMLGGLLQAFTGDDRLLMGINQSLSIFLELGIDMGNLMWVVVLAAVGLKAVDRIGKP